MKQLLYTIALVCLTGFSSQAQKDIKITNFTAHAKDTKLVIDWATDGTVSTNYWQVQRSQNGTEFTTIAFIMGPDPKQPGDRYTYVEKVKDTKLINAYYRLVHTGVDGKEIISNTIMTAK